MTDAYDEWLAQRASLAERFISGLPADETKKAELRRELADHDRIVAQVVSQLPVLPEPPTCAWEAGWFLASSNLISNHDGIAPRSESAAKQWVDELLEQIQIMCGINLYKLLLHRQTIMTEATSLWRASGWFGQIPARNYQQRQYVEETRLLEKRAVAEFLNLYNATSENQYRLVPRDVNDKPDAVLEGDDGSLLGIEVAHLYHDEQEAKLVLGRATGFNSGVQSEKNIIDKLNTLLSKKQGKREGYDVENVSLLIRVVSPIFDEEDFAFHLEQGDIQIPKDVYKDIWLLVDTGPFRQFNCLINLT